MPDPPLETLAHIWGVFRRRSLTYGPFSSNPRSLDHVPFPGSAISTVAIAPPKIGTMAAMGLGKVNNMGDSLMLAGSDVGQQRAHRA